MEISSQKEIPRQEEKGQIVLSVDTNDASPKTVLDLKRKACICCKKLKRIQERPSKKMILNQSSLFKMSFLIKLSVPFKYSQKFVIPTVR